MTTDVAEPDDNSKRDGDVGGQPLKARMALDMQGNWTLLGDLKGAGKGASASDLVALGWTKALEREPRLSSALLESMERVEKSLGESTLARIKLHTDELGRLSVAKVDFSELAGAARLSDLFAEQVRALGESIRDAVTPTQVVGRSALELLSSQQRVVDASPLLSSDSLATWVKRAERSTKKVRTDLEISPESGVKFSRSSESETVSTETALVAINEGINRLIESGDRSSDVMTKELPAMRESLVEVAATAEASRVLAFNAELRAEAAAAEAVKATKSARRSELATWIGASVGILTLAVTIVTLVITH